MKRTIEFMYCAEESLLATLCWGFWQGSYKFRNHMINVKCFLDDSRGGVHWTCEPSTKAVILLGTELVEINGTFRHNDCKRVSLEGVPFSNLQCSSCASIPKERDFCMRVYRDMHSRGERGLRDTGGGRRLDYLTHSEILRIAKTKK